MPTSKFTTPHFRNVAITSGDPKGIGFEVTSKALFNLGPQPKTIFFLYRDRLHHKRQLRYFKLLDQKFLRVTFASQMAAFSFLKSLQETRFLPKNILIDLAMPTSAAEWVLEAARSCLKKEYASLVTAPISKTLIQRSGFPFVGHTGAFRSLLPNANLHMAFIGKDFNVLLASDHIPLSRVSTSLTKQKIFEALAAARYFKKLVGSKKKIAVLGLNPHSGEKGLLGSFERTFMGRLPEDVVGPLVPDAAFLKSNWKKYSVYVCLYHDQGLIPFKMIHGQDSGVHITMGLPFVRTSVDHGTAFDIYNKNIANPASMLEAIQLNLKLIRGKNV